MSVEVCEKVVGPRGPWVSAFGRSGVTVHVERAGSGSIPYATLPSREGLRSARDMASWFSVAAEAAARGFYTRVKDEPVAVQSPVSEPSVLSEAVDTVEAYTQPDEAVQAAIHDVARAIDGRGLPTDKEDIVGGDCYLALISPEYHDVARKRFGLAPTLRELCVFPLEWLRPVHECARVGVVVRGSVMHMQDGGGDGILSGLDLVLAARVTVMKLRAERLPDVLLDTRVAGGTLSGAWLDALTSGHPVYPSVQGEAFQREFLKCHIDHGSCFGHLVSSWFGNVALGKSVHPYAVLPWSVLDQLLQRRVGTSWVTMYVVGKKVCVIPGSHTGGGGRVRKARNVLRSLYEEGLELCTDTHGPDLAGKRVCNVCGYPERDLEHGSRCAIPSSLSVEADRSSFRGDSVHATDVRSAVLSVNIPETLRTRTASLYCSAAGQAAFVRAFGAPCDIGGWKDKRVSDHFEAWYVDYYRAAYVWWLVRDVRAVASEGRGYLTDVPDSVAQLREWCEKLKGVAVAGIVGYECHMQDCDFSTVERDIYEQHVRSHGVARDVAVEPFYAMAPIAHEGYTLHALKRVFPYAGPDKLRRWFVTHMELARLYTAVPGGMV